MTTEPPYADPLVRWCGRAEPVRVPPMPIKAADVELRLNNVKEDDPSNTFSCFLSCEDGS